MSRLDHQAKRITLTLKKDLSRSIKQGHAWIFSDAVDRISAPSGSVAVLKDRKGQSLAAGIYCPNHPITVRICLTDQPFELNDTWLKQRLASAIHLRDLVSTNETTGCRLVNGEGDGLPGLIVDRYDRTAVIKLDGGSPENFYQPHEIAGWLTDTLGLNCVVQRVRGRGEPGRVLIGNPVRQPVHFLENGICFSADVINGQKTGFFLDQRDNRNLVRQLSEGRRVLNLFSFSGGFSVAAGLGKAASVHSIDISTQAIDACKEHWQRNGLPASQHTAEVADCFKWLQQATRKNLRWDLVICDPPSFSPSQQTLLSAMAAYSKLAQWTSQLVNTDGLVALASCSSHVNLNDFHQANLKGFGRARRQARLLSQQCLPMDHPTPQAMPELRYLKFQLFALN